MQLPCVAMRSWRDNNLRPVRFFINGLVCTVIHYSALAIVLESEAVRLAGIANIAASGVGILASFFGNRLFVFLDQPEPWPTQLLRFWALYAALAVMQGIVLFVLTDLFGLNYSIGFIIGAGAAAICTYAGGRLWVFKEKS